ncbi:hypothetical protein [Mycobacterium sp. OTB74]|jgi:hypothetical protein|uniref:hypothetical protein n=1 Tax=Mycobacterium sp. OTB74 TaxID=1853452 RepID=UPI002475F24B|nr:hypothetical protein [Mycobacterium sp. OTB74]MDH6245177.1 hypothetical protein [Mycobacterium sp. OTB74]
MSGHGCQHSSDEHAATARLTTATWILIVATVALCILTGMLTDATLLEKEKTGHETVQTGPVPE